MCDRGRQGGCVVFFISYNLEHRVSMNGPNNMDSLLVSAYNEHNTNNTFCIGLWYIIINHLTIKLT